MKKNNNITVSVCCMTYNQENYIEEALRSILNQKTNFDFEIIVHDDASTDNTVEIVKGLSKGNKQIVPIYQKENKYSQENIQVWYKYMFPICKGKYIAICDGDDYWTDNYKLQKQVDFLENNLSFSIVGTHMTTYHEDNNSFENWMHPKYSKTEFDIKDLAEGNFIFASSVLLRNDFFIEDWWYNLPIGDWPLYLMQINNRKIKIFKDSMGVYRKHSQGVHTGINKNQKDIKIRDCIFKLLMNSNLDSKIKLKLLNIPFSEKRDLQNDFFELKKYSGKQEKDIQELKKYSNKLEKCVQELKKKR